MSDHADAAVIVVHAQPVDSESEAERDFFREPVLIADAEEVLPLHKQMRVWCVVVFFAGSIGLAVFLAIKITKSSSKEASTSISVPSPIPSTPPTVSDSPSLSPTASPTNNPSLFPSVVPSITASPTSYKNNQMNALNALYEATNGERWRNAANLWGSDDIGICSWYGVLCNGNADVIEIDLRSNNLQGM